MYHNWSNSEIEFLKKNYPKCGKEYCSQKLQLDISKIKGKVQRLDLHLEDKTDIRIFENIKTKETAYIMGLLWADGYINEKNYCIGIEANYDDMINLEGIIMKIGNWKKYQRHRDNCKMSLNYCIGFKKLFYIFKNYDFDKKSKVSPNKILNSLSEDLKKYFYRGLIDGDGCFYINKKHYNYQFTLASSFEQDWTYIVELFKMLDIKSYTKRESVSNNGSHSVIRVTNKKDIFKIGNYIYHGYDTDNIGLKRKYDKYEEIRKRL